MIPQPYRDGARPPRRYDPDGYPNNVGEPVYHQIDSAVQNAAIIGLPRGLARFV